MCGIFGAAGPHLNPADVDARASLQAMAHRGPDGHGLWSGPSVLLGHLRLAIIDLSERGRQPMRDAERGVTLSFNGEIYNFLEIRAQLEREGVKFNSDSDTEVLLEAYCAWGAGVFPRLNGMFAVAIHDAAREVLTLARDHVGIKPLYYVFDDRGNLHFSSEIKGIRRDLRQDLNQDSVGEYLYYGTNHGAATLYRGVFKVLPGTYSEFAIATGDLTHVRYWQLPSAQSCEAGRLRQAAAAGKVGALTTLLHSAVGRQLVSDRPVGVFLSGGVDSSAIACIAANGHGRNLDMFTARFSSAKDDTDVRIASRLSKELRCPHHVVDIDDLVTIDLVDEMIGQFDGPFADAAAIPLSLLSRALPAEMKVILQGDGGDELFCGYPRYGYLRMRDRMNSLGGVIPASLRWLGGVSPEMLSRRWRRIVMALGDADDAKVVARLLTVDFPEHEFAPEKLMAHYVPASTGPFATIEEQFRSAPGTTVCDRALAVDFHATLPDLFLEKVDRSTMAASIEVRVPMLDREVVEFAAGLTASERMPGGRPKQLLRNALAEIVPDYVLSAPKRGFGVPYGMWIRGPLLQPIRDELDSSELFNHGAVARMLTQHLTGKQDHAFMIWKLFLLSRWLRRRDSAGRLGAPGSTRSVLAVHVPGAAPPGGEVG